MNNRSEQIARLQEALLEERIDRETYESLKADLDIIDSDIDEPVQQDVLSPETNTAAHLIHLVGCSKGVA